MWVGVWWLPSSDVCRLPAVCKEGRVFSFRYISNPATYWNSLLLRHITLPLILNKIQCLDPHHGGFVAHMARVRAVWRWRWRPRQRQEAPSLWHVPTSLPWAPLRTSVIRKGGMCKIDFCLWDFKYDERDAGIYSKMITTGKWYE